MNKIHVQNCSIWGGNLARAMERREGGKAKGRQPEKAYDSLSLPITPIPVGWLSPTAGKACPLTSPLQHPLYVWRLFCLDSVQVTLVCDHVHMCILVTGVHGCVACLHEYACTPLFVFSPGSFGKQEAGPPHAAFQELPTQACPAERSWNGAWKPAQAPWANARSARHEPWLESSVQRKGIFCFFLITGPPRETTSCKLLGQRELVPNLNQGALCARVPFRREESTEIKPLPGGRAVHQAHQAEWLMWVWGETGLQPALKRPWAPWVVSMEGIWNLALEWNLQTLS